MVGLRTDRVSGGGVLPLAGILAASTGFRLWPLCGDTTPWRSGTVRVDSGGLGRGRTRCHQFATNHRLSGSLVLLNPGPNLQRRAGGGTADGGTPDVPAPCSSDCNCTGYWKSSLPNTPLSDRLVRTRG